MADTSKHNLYNELLQQAASLIEGEPDYIANLANISALLFNTLPDVNWAGCYLYKDEQLVLGPFQGQPACIRIPMNKGVCGAAATSRTTQLVDNVHEFAGHIACDSASNSEIVLPILCGDNLFGVLDIDSPSLARFDGVDAKYLEKLVKMFEKSLT